MAQGKKQTTDYNALVRRLRSGMVSRLYLLWGEEDYLRERFAEQLRLTWLPDGGDWNLRRIDGQGCDYSELDEAVTSLPFLSEHTLVELRGFEINSCKEADAERLKQIVSDIPEWCVLVVTLPTAYEPDGRLSAFKTLRKLGEAIEFTAQGQGQLITWIFRRFEAQGMTISRSGAEQLVFMCGALMNRLIPEVDKLCGYVKGLEVSEADVTAVAIKFPEANVFEMTELLAQKKFSQAAAVLQELLDSRAEPIMIHAMIGRQLRQLYMARLVLDDGGTVSDLMDALDVKYEFIAKRLHSSARGFDTQQLADAVRLCAETDFALKGSRSAEGAEPLKDLLLKLAVRV